MSRWTSYIGTAEEITRQYNGGIPLSHWLKDYFRQHKKMGSTDRKSITSLVYQYYRTCHAFSRLPFEEHALAARFLCQDSPDALLAAIRPRYNNHIKASLSEKQNLLAADFKALSGTGTAFKYFPFTAALSNGIDYAQFNNSFLVQPDLFLRLRPGKGKQVMDKLGKANIPFVLLDDGAVVIANQSQVDAVIELNREAVVQDYNSQAVGKYLGLDGSHSRLQVWDCCAASGGKSIMAFDRNPQIALTVSDVRNAILVNLAKRFQEAGITKYKSFKADLTRPLQSLNSSYDLVIADLPCSGSGTWSRSPEQLYFFQESKIEYYSSLQKLIMLTIMPAVKKPGRLVYITCSVFEQENEAVAEFAAKKSGMKIIEMQLLKGYTMKADSLFVAVLEY